MGSAANGRERPRVRHEPDVLCNSDQPAIIDLLAKGYITSSLYSGIVDGDDQMFRLTVKGGKCVEELIAATVEQ